MKILARILCFLAALHLGLTPATGNYLINPYWFSSAAPANEFVACVESTTDLTTYTFTGANVGTAHALRHTIVAVGGEDGTADFSVSTVTVGGDSATLDYSSASSAGAVSSLASSAIFSLDNPVGTAEDVVVTFSEAVTGAVICVYNAYDLVATAPLGSQTRISLVGAIMPLSPVPAGGYVVAFNVNMDPATTYVWTGLTADVTTAGTEQSWTAADGSTAAGGPIEVTIDPNSGAGINNASVQVTWPTTLTVSNTIITCRSTDADLTTYTFAATPVGLADANRRTIVSVGGEDGTTAFTVSTVTVGGASGVLAADGSNAGSLVTAYVYILANAAATSEDVVVTFSEAVTSGGICVWAVYDVASNTPTDTAVDFETVCAAMTLDLDVAAGAFAVGYAVTGAFGDGVWTGMTQRAENSYVTEVTSSAADTTTTGTPLAVTADMANAGDCNGVSAAFN